MTEPEIPEPEPMNDVEARRHARQRIWFDDGHAIVSKQPEIDDPLPDEVAHPSRKGS